MEEITTVGNDLAKSIFQVHAVDPAGRVVVQRALKRRELVTFFEKHPHASSGWRRAAASTTGAAC